MDDRLESSQPGGYFPPTAWTTVLAGKGGDLEALNRLFTRYRRPIILEVLTRRRCSFEEAEELAHEFMQTLLRREFLGRVSLHRGRFRTLLKKCLHNFLIDVARRSPEVATVPLDAASADQAPTQGYVAREEVMWPTLDREWIRAVMTGAMERLERECAEDGLRGRRYLDSFRERLTSDLDGSTYAQIAAGLGVDDGAVRVAHHRLRKRLLECMQLEVREITATAEDFALEWATLTDYAKGG